LAIYQNNNHLQYTTMKQLLFKFATIICLALSFINVKAQLSSNYSFTTATNGSLALDMNGNTVDMSSGTTLLIDYGSDEVRTSIYPIGFEFLMLYGTNSAFYRHTTFSVTSNGLMRLGEYTSATRYNIAQDGEYGIISPFARNLATHSTGKVHYKLVGTAPNRCLVVEWKNMEVDNASTTADATYQARLYETTGIVEFVYGVMNVGVGGGISNYQIGISNDDNATRLISVQSSDNTISTTAVINNTYTAGTTIPNLHSTTDGSRRVYRFTPPTIPTAPTAQAYSNIQCNQVRLNWTDNATNEVQYEIYQSANAGGPFVYVARVAANITNTTIYGLSQNTNYYFRIRAVTEGTASDYIDLDLVTTLTACGICETVQDGNWNQATTWLCGHVPYTYEDAIVKHNVKITVDMWGVNNVTIQNGGYLYFNATNNLDFQVYGDLTIDDGGRFHSATDNSSVIYLYGNMIVNGEYDGNRGTNGTNLYFQGIDNKTITGNNATVCDFYTLTLNKGASKEAVVEVLREITLREPTANGNSLVLSNGTFKLSSASVLTPYRGNQSVCGVTSKFWLNNAAAVVKRVDANTGQMYIWDFQLDAGTFTNSGQTYFYSEVVVNDGTLQDLISVIGISGKLTLNNGSISSPSFTDNGEVYINGGTLTTTSGNYLVDGYSKGISEINGGTISIGADFDIENKLTVNGGTINVSDEVYVDHNGADEYGYLDFSNATMNVAAMVQITDYGTLKINSGTINSGDGNDDFNIDQGAELIMNGGTINHYGRLTFDNGTLAAQSKFTMTAGNININPQLTNNLQNVDVVQFQDNTIVNFTGGTLTIIDPELIKNGADDSEFEVVGVAGAKNFAGSTIQFGNASSTSAQGTISGVRGFRISTHASVQLDNVVVLNTNPSTDRDLVLSNTISNTLNINNLTLSNADSKLNINGNTLNIAIDLVNNGSINGTTAGSHLLFVGNQAQEYSGTGSVTSNLLTLTFNNTSATGVTLSAPLGATQVNLTDGNIYTDATNLLTVYGTTAANLTGGSATNYVVGPLQRTIPNNASNITYNFPVGKTDYQLFEMFGVTSTGSGTGYLTAEYFEGATTGIGGNGIRNTPFNADNGYWKIDNALNTVALSNVTKVRVTKSVTTPPAKVLAQSNNTHIGGTYNSIGGTIAGGTVTSDSYDLTGNTSSSTAYILVAEVDPLIGTYYVGDPATSPDATRTFWNLTAVAQVMREKVVDDYVFFEMLQSYDDGTETLPIVFDVLSATNAAYTVTIRPQTGVSGTHTEQPSLVDNQSMIIIDGIRHLIFDGRPGSAGTSDWIFSNTKATNPGATFEFRNGATYNQLNYITIKSNNNSATEGSVVFSTTNSTIGNSNNTIQNCTFTGLTTSPRNAVYSAGTAAYPNSGNQILNNNFKDIFIGNQDTRIVSLDANSSAWTISGNKFYHTSPKTFTAGNILYNIDINSGTGHTINENIFGYADDIQTATGYTEISGSTGRYIGIRMNVGNGTYSDLTNNIFSNIKLSTASTDQNNGIFNPLFIVAGDVNVGTVGNGNIIGTTGTFTDYPIEITYTAGGGQVIGIFCSSPRLLNFSDNQIGGIRMIGNFDMWFIGLQTDNNATTANYTISGNTIGSTTKANSIWLGNSTDNTSKNIYGIWGYECYTSVITNNIIANITGQTTSTNGGNCNIGIYAERAPYTITGNQIFNLKHSTGTTDDFFHASLNGISVTSPEAIAQIITNNIIYGLENNNVAGNRSVKITGIYIDNDNVALPRNIVNGNFIHSFKINSTDATSGMTGLLIDDGNHLVTNNMVRLGIDAAGSSITSSHLIYGINFNGDNTADFYHNSVYIGGTGVSGAANTYSFFKRETFLSNILNNIFVNDRSNGTGTGSHIAYYLSFDEVINTDYNIYYASGTGGVTAQFDGTNFQLLRAMQTYTNYKDLHSGVGNPNFITPTGDASTVNLHLSGTSPAEGMGVVGYATTDFDNEDRSTLTPADIGADAGNFTFDASVDIYAPTFIYNAIDPQSCGVASATIDVRIMEQGVGISNVAGSRPRVWYRYIDDAWTAASWVEGTLQSGTVNDGVWRFVLTGLEDGKKYEYYVVAQDVATSKNLGYSKFDADAPVNTNVATISTAPDAGVDIDFFTVCVNPKSTYYVGNLTDCSGCDFETLTAYGDFFYNMNAMTIDKNVTCYIKANTTEPATFGAEELFVEPAGSNFTITILPFDATLKTLTTPNTVNKTQILFEGADRYTIDGSFNNDGNRWLNFIHEKNDQANFKFVNDAQYNTLKYLIIEGSTGLNPSGIIHIDTALVSGNDFNSIDHNIITYKTGLPPLNLIYSYGSTSLPLASNSDISITNNILYDFKQYSIWVTNRGNGDNWNISENIIFNTVVTDTLQNAIRMETGSGHTVYKNLIGGSDSNNDGLWVNDGTSEFQAIYLDVLNTSKTVVDNNLITNIQLSNNGWAGTSRAIRAVNNSWVDITNNTITNIERLGRQNFYVISYSTTEPTEISGNTIRNITTPNANETDLYGIYLNTDDADINTVNDNTITGISQLSASGSSDLFGIYINNGIANVNNNDIGGPNPADKITVTAGNFQGISFYNDDTEHNITENSITNVELGGARTFRGFYLYDMQDNILFNMQNNVIDNITLSNTGASAFYGYDLRDGKINFNTNICGTPALGISNAGTGVTYAVYFYQDADANSIIDNNMVQNIKGNGNTFAIYSNRNVTHAISNNTISEIAIANDIAFCGIKIDAGTTTTSGNIINSIRLTNTGINTSLCGIWVSAGLYTIDSNTFTSMQTSGTGEANIVQITSATAGTSNITNNLIENIDNSGNSILRAINLSNIGGTSIVNVENNRIYNFKNNGTGTNTHLTGIELYNNGKANITGNIIGNPLVADDILNAGAGNTNGIFVYSGVSGQTISTNSLTNITRTGNGYLAAINASQVGAGSASVIGSNRIEYLKNTSTGTSASIKAIKAGTGATGLFQISDNLISNITQSGNSSFRGIELDVTTPAQVLTNNSISYITQTTPYEFNGLYLKAGTGSSSSVQDNVIQDITLTNNASFYGMNIQGGMFTASTNTIGHTSTANSISNAGSTTVGFLCNSAYAVTFQNNLIANISSTNTGATAYIAGVEVTGVGTTTVESNTIRNLTTPSGNTNFSTGKVAAQGIYISGNSASIISKNLINNIFCTGSAATHIAGISENAPNAIITKNRITALANNSSAAGRTVNGLLLISSSNSTRVSNQFISLGNADNASYRGVWIPATNANTKYVVFNSIYIGGTATGGSSYAFLRGNVSTPLYLRNNILSNFRTGGSGKHYAIATENTADWVQSYAKANCLYSATASTTGLWGSTDVNYDTWITNSGGDDESLSNNEDPQFTDPANNNLHINPADACAFNSVGEIIASVPQDIDDENRTTFPDIGADEFNPTGGNGRDIWRGWVSSAWENNINWQCELEPLTTSNLLVPNVTNDPIIGVQAECNELEIKANGEVKISPNSSLKLNGNLTLNGKLTVKSTAAGTGSFIDNGTITGSGTVLVERHITPGGWHYFSTPVAGTSNKVVTEYLNCTKYNRNLLYYNEDYTSTNPSDPKDWQNGWVWMALTPNTSLLDIPKGYAAYIDGSCKSVIEMNGNTADLKTGDESISVSNKDASAELNTVKRRGWNLIGNPYPSHLNANAFLAANSGVIDGAVYFWDELGKSDFDDDGYDYACWNGSGSVGTGSGSFTPDGFISVGQSFFVHKTTTGSGTVDFTNAMRTNTPAHFFKGGEYVQRLKIAITNPAKHYNETLIAFTANATDGYDSYYDALKMQGNQHLALYSQLNNLAYTIQSFEPFTKDSKTVPLGLKSSIAGKHIFSLANIENMPYNIYLEDKELNTIVNLRSNPEYQFETTGEVVLNERFFIRFEINTPPVSKLQINDTEVDEDSELNYDIDMNTFEDNDFLDKLSYRAVLANGAALPAWLQFDNQMLTFKGMPTNSQVGIYNILLIASDLAGKTASQTFSLKVNNTNDAPVPKGEVANVDLVENQTFDISLDNNIFFDEDKNDRLTITLSGVNTQLPSWLNFDANAMVLFGTAPSNQDIEIELVITATDLLNASCSTTFLLKVSNQNDAPYLSKAIENRSIAIGQLLLLNINGTFADADANDELNYVITQIDGSPLPDWLYFNPITKQLFGVAPEGFVGIIEINVTAFDKSQASCSEDFTIEITELSAIETEEINAISVFPNPAKDFVTIKTDRDCSISIMDILGRKLIEKQIYKGATTIDLRNLAMGVYNIEFTSKEISVSKKLIIAE